jgi:mRNA-degrading endonuclease toxin of MazEF toxin-antitoxin module
VSADALTDAGTALMIELVDKAPEGTRGLLSVPLAEYYRDFGCGGAARADRLGYFATARLGEPVGQIDDDTMADIDSALRVALDLD